MKKIKIAILPWGNFVHWNINLSNSWLQQFWVHVNLEGSFTAVQNALYQNFCKDIFEYSKVDFCIHEEDQGYNIAMGEACSLKIKWSNSDYEIKWSNSDYSSSDSTCRFESSFSAVQIACLSEFPQGFIWIFKISWLCPV